MKTITQPGEIGRPHGVIPFLFLPRGEDLFAKRAHRFQALAENHVLGDYLRLMGQLAQAQQNAMDDFSTLSHPAPAYLEQCCRQRMPPLGVLGWQREPAWRAGLQRILAEMSEAQTPANTSEAMAHLGRTGVDDLEMFASSLLNHDLAAVPAVMAPFVAAALQVYWTSMTAALQGWNLPRLESANLCPVCGSPPVAGVVQSGGTVNGLRYLCCSLCSSQWHMVRGICSNCDATKGITYFGIEGQTGPVTAESCNGCRTYLKIIKLEKDLQADPLSDDLAMLALDLLMDQAGRNRHGANLLFHPGNG
jgi:FdhE protein